MLKSHRTQRKSLFGHEMGHGLGAGDQYKGGVDKNGVPLAADVSGAQRSIMFDKGGPANQQTIDEIAAHAVGDRKNTIVRCDVKMVIGC